MQRIRAWVIGWLAAALVIILMTLFAAHRVQAQSEASAVGVVPTSSSAQVSAPGALRVFTDDSDVITDDVAGTAVAFGSTILQKNQIRGDFLALAGSVVLDGVIEQDVYVAAGSVFVRGEVHGNIFVLAGEVQIEPSAQVLGSVVSLAETIQIQGQVGKDANLMAKDIVYTGIVSGTSQIRANSLQVAETAQVGTVSGQVENLDRSSSASVSGNFAVEVVTKSEPAAQKKTLREHIRVVVKAAAAGALLCWLIWFLQPPVWLALQKNVKNHWPAMALWGGAAGLFWPLVAAVLLATVIGVPVAVVGTIGWLIMLWLGWVIVAIPLAEALRLEGLKVPRWVAVVVVGAVAGALFATPWFGWVFRLINGLFGLGIVAWSLWTRRKPVARKKSATT